jgi:rRNA-processing protein FCF1
VKTRPAVQILLDTSFLLTMLKQHRDPVEEIRAEVPGNVRVLILDLVIFELERLARKAPVKTQAYARESLDFIGNRIIPVIEHKPGPSDVDAALIACSLTEREPTGIATVDRALRSALASQDVPVIYPRTRRGLIAGKFHF